MDEILTLNKDIEYYLSQKQSDIDKIVAGMTALMSDVEGKYEAMKNQNWFKRMVKTVTGKNKAAVADILKNSLQLSAYCAKALAAFIERQKISEGIILNLGTQINTLYASHLDLKQILHGIASKLNEKIECVDNFHILIHEINLGKFGQNYIDIYLILALLDKRMVDDDRKMVNLLKLLQEKSVLTDEKINVETYLLSVCDTQSDFVGSVYMEALIHTESLIAQMTVAAFEGWNFLPESNRQLLEKKSVVKRVLDTLEIKRDASLSLAVEYEQLLENKRIISKREPLNPFSDATEEKSNGDTYNFNEAHKDNKESEKEEMKDEDIFIKGLKLLYEGNTIISPKINWAMRVQDGGVFWEDIAKYEGWRVQKNVATSHLRVLTKESRRIAWGFYSELLEAFKDMIKTKS